MMKKLTHGALALALAGGIFAATAQDAEAGRRGRGVAAGIAIGTILGLGIAGAYAGPRHYGSCYSGPRVCDYVGRSCWYNRWGERVCRGGQYRCWRERICD